MKNTLAIIFGGFLVAFAAWALLFPVFHKVTYTTNNLHRMHNYVGITLQPVGSSGVINLNLTTKLDQYIMEWYDSREAPLINQFQFDVKDSNGKPVHHTMIGQVYQQAPAGYTAVTDGTTQSLHRLLIEKNSPQVITINLGNLYKLKPGLYSVQVTIMPENDKSNAIPIVVTSTVKSPTLRAHIRTDHSPMRAYTEI